MSVKPKPSPKARSLSVSHHDLIFFSQIYLDPEPDLENDSFFLELDLQTVESNKSIRVRAALFLDQLRSLGEELLELADRVDELKAAPATPAKEVRTTGAVKVVKPEASTKTPQTNLLTLPNINPKDPPGVVRDSRKLPLPDPKDWLMIKGLGFSDPDLENGIFDLDLDLETRRPGLGATMRLMIPCELLGGMIDELKQLKAVYDEASR